MSERKKRGKRVQYNINEGGAGAETAEATEAEEATERNGPGEESEDCFKHLFSFCPNKKAKKAQWPV